MDRMLVSGVRPNDLVNALIMVREKYGTDSPKYKNLAKKMETYLSQDIDNADAQDINLLIELFEQSPDFQRFLVSKLIDKFQL